MDVKRFVYRYLHHPVLMNQVDLGGFNPAVKIQC